jgi:N-acetylneuraminic acid mutarotase
MLVAGGNNPSGDLSSAEIYDPTTGSWSFTGVMPTTRNASTAALLPDGCVLVAGGYDSDGICGSAVLYDPATGKWKTTGFMSAGHYGHTMTLLASGKVLIAGGENGGGSAKNCPSLKTAELFDPGTGRWTLTSPMTAPRSEHTATLLADGRVLVTGGYTDGGLGGESLASAELYNPITGKWTETGAMHVARCYLTATLLPDGKVLVAGGFGGTDSATTAELFNPATGKWTLTGPMKAEHSQHKATLLSDGRVVVVGGDPKVEIYNPVTGTWTAAGKLNFPFAFADHTATLLPNGKVLIAGGFYAGTHVASSEIFVPSAGK